MLEATIEIIGPVLAAILALFAIFSVFAGWRWVDARADQAEARAKKLEAEADHAEAEARRARFRTHEEDRP